MASNGVNSNAEQCQALSALVKQGEFTKQVFKLQTERTASRFINADRYLDENEREWYALDKLLRSRPWATNQSTPFQYPFRKVSEDMQRIEGTWISDRLISKENTRGDAACDIIAQVYVPAEFPPEHRVLLFTPEFGNDASFDMESWSFLEPEGKVDMWVVCWQGWQSIDDMLDEVTRKVASFADGVNTVWFGQGMGALVAYEVIKRFQQDKLQCPSLPISLVVADCPAPHLFSDAYKPYESDSFADAFAHLSERQRGIVEADVAMMKSYKFKGSDRVPVPIAALTHEDSELAKEEDVKAWEECAKNGVDCFEFVDPLDATECEDYLNGKGNALNVDPPVLATISEHLEKYSRWTVDDESLDIGATDGPLPDEIDALIIGAGLNGIFMAAELSKAGKQLLILERHHEIGGVWEFYGNEYSRVNTSEIGYRILDKDGDWQRPNEDHTPRRDILRDMRRTLSEHCRGCVRVNIEVLKVDKNDQGGYLVKTRNVQNNEEHVIRARSVSIHVNRRLGTRRQVNWPGAEQFRGKHLYGYANEPLGCNFWNKSVLIVGAGAFAFENVRTALEHGARFVTLLGRRDGTTCPKWIDMLAYMRPYDETWLQNKSANMLSFEAWQKCYKDAGLRTPQCWDEGMLKPHNHTISVSDIAFIAGYHGMFSLKVGEIKSFTDDGKGVELCNGERLDVDILIKCTGFHINEDVPLLTGKQKMHPYGFIDHNLQYSAEPLLDGGQFGSAKGTVEIDQTNQSVDMEQFKRGLEVSKALGLDDNTVQNNVFGSGQGGPGLVAAKYATWLLQNEDQQKALLKHSGEPSQDIAHLWLSQIGQYMKVTFMRLVASLGSMEHGKLA